jgi:hypothetical protein
VFWQSTGWFLLCRRWPERRSSPKGGDNKAQVFALGFVIRAFQAEGGGALGWIIRAFQADEPSQPAFCLG